jgi:LysM repeat protein
MPGMSQKEKYIIWSLTILVLLLAVMAFWLIVYQRASLTKALARVLEERSASAQSVLNGVEPDEQQIVNERLAELLTMMAQNREETTVAVAPTPTGNAESVVIQLPASPIAVPPAQECAPQTYKVVRGDNLWRVAEKHYGKGSGHFYTEIAKAQKEKMRTPYVIHPGDVLVIPTLNCSPPASTNKRKQVAAASVGKEGSRYARPVTGVTVVAVAENEAQLASAPLPDPLDETLRTHFTAATSNREVHRVSPRAVHKSRRITIYTKNRTKRVHLPTHKPLKSIPNFSNTGYPMGT